MADLYGDLSIRLIDSEGVSAAYPLYLKIADTTTLAQIITDVAAYCALLDPLTDARGSSVSIRLTLPTTGLKSVITVNNQVSNAGAFGFQLYQQPGTGTILIPAFAEAQMVNGKINMEATAVSNWTDWIAGNATHLAVTDDSRFLMNAVKSSFKATRKHRKSQTRTSFTKVTS